MSHFCPSQPPVVSLRCIFNAEPTSPYVSRHPLQRRGADDSLLCMEKETMPCFDSRRVEALPGKKSQQSTVGFDNSIKTVNSLVPDPPQPLRATLAALKTRWKWFHVAKLFPCSCLKAGIKAPVTTPVPQYAFRFSLTPVKQLCPVIHGKRALSTPKKKHI